MSDHIFNVLFLCTGNSARSIIAEAILNRVGAGRFKAFSAGSHPKGEVHPYALQLLKTLNHDTSFARSKDWNEFAAPGAPEMNFVFTVCDNAANEACPVWPGQPMTAHWGVPDPAAVEGTEAEKHLAFADTYRMLNNRISIFISLPMNTLDKLALQKRLDEIGRESAEGRLSIVAFDLSRRLVAEALGTAMLVATVVGSGIMADRLTDDVAVALLGNTLPTGAILVVLITILGPISGAHFNPAVTLVFALRREIEANAALAYVAAQIAGGIAGTFLAHAMFELPILQLSTTVRTGTGQWIAEAVAAFGLVFTILAGLRFRSDAIPWLVGLYITAAYWFTASTSFANPAVAIARALSDTFAGIRPVDLPGFIAAELLGALLAMALAGWLLAEPKPIGQMKAAK